MIINVQEFIAREKTHWEELEALLNKLEKEPGREMQLDDAQKLHYLYQRASSNLVKLAAASPNTELYGYLEALVARAYCEVHSSSEQVTRFRPIYWFTHLFPQAFRRHASLFSIVCLLFGAGALFGAVALMIDQEAKSIIMPFSHLHGDPSDRVAEEEAQTTEEDHMEDVKATFAGQLMTHNIRVSINVLCLGITWGIGTVILLFYNGVILGAVALDYVRAGETTFLLAWLLPHGSVEIPAILLGALGGLIIARSLLGRGSHKKLGLRMREALPDVLALVYGLAILLVWAGIIESYFSQYHQPVIPYSVKIAFGALQLLLLILFLTYSGKEKKSANRGST